jgi:hypothetical protein
MAFTEKELERYRKIVGAYVEERRPPAHVRDQVDLSFRIYDQSIEIFEIRSVGRDSQRKVEIPIAKTTWVRTQKVWRIYWQRADMKWHGYTPQPEVKSLEEFIEVVKADEYACFFG